MYKKYLLSFIILLIGRNTMSQDVVSQIPFRNVKEIYSYTLGNNTLFGCEEKIGDSWHFACNLVSQGGVLKKLDLTKEEFNSIITISEVGPGTWRLYVAREKNKKPAIGTIELDLSSRSKTSSPDAMEITNWVIGTQVDGKELVIYSYNKKNGFELIISRSEDMVTVTENRFALPFDLNLFKEWGIGFTPPSRYASIVQVVPEVKIVPSKKTADIIIDNYKKNAKDTKDKTSGTLLLHINEIDNSIETNFIEEPATSDKQRVSYRTYLCNGLLFRATLQRELLTLKIIDPKHNELIYSKKINRRDESITSMPVYYRDVERDLVTNREESMFTLMAYPENKIPFLAVDHDSVSGHYSIACGTTVHPLKKGGVLLWNPPIIGFMVTILSTAIVQMIDNNYYAGPSKYFYLNGSPDRGFDIFANDPDNGTRQKIDSFEMTKMNAGKSSLRYKKLSYSQFNKGILGVYQDKKEKNVKLVSF